VLAEARPEPARAARRLRELGDHAREVDGRAVGKRVTIDHVARVLHVRIATAAQLHEVERVPNRRQRIAQLMRERREKLILAAIRFLESPRAFANRFLCTRAFDVEHRLLREQICLMHLTLRWKMRTGEVHGQRTHRLAMTGDQRHAVYRAKALLACHFAMTLEKRIGLDVHDDDASTLGERDSTRTHAGLDVAESANRGIVEPGAGRHHQPLC